MTTGYADTYRETVELPLDTLARYPGNPRHGDVEKIRASLRRHGQYRALIVRNTPDGSLVILAGNHTADAMRAEGWTNARCELHECDDDTARRINLVDNRLPDFGTFDDALLIEQLSALNGDLDGIGYTDDDLTGLIDNWTDEEAARLRDLTPPASSPSAAPMLPGQTRPAPEARPEPAAPAEFPSYDDDISTDYRCPSCSYEWSGKPK